MQQGRAEEFARLEEEVFKPLWEQFQGWGCQPVLLAVPGNHDLIRPGTKNGGRKKLTAAERVLVTPGFFEEIAEEFWTEPASEWYESKGNKRKWKHTE